MIKKKTYFLVGFFVLAGALIAVGTIIWLGASQYLQKGERFVTYFDESVQGLQVDSSVKYRGVEIGMVEKIGVAPDYRLIEVVMKINFSGDAANATIAKLKAAGITGIVYVELDHRKKGDIARTPQITFEPDYPVIPSNPSEIQEIVSGVDDVVKKMKEVDFKAISDELVSATRSVNTFFAGQKMTRIVTNLENMTQTLSDSANQLAKMVGDGRADGILSDARDTVRDAKETIARVKSELEQMRVAETAAKTTRMIEDISRRSKTIAMEVQLTGENLRRASENLDQLIERLKADPSDILFSDPPPKKR
ncbi:MAG: paraquat-inducible protein B [Syntrophorhabdus sp. PtaB.Bin047]|nr:MAG: paraquat-inducible protein B [Syntrophorhabdus sp. PtaB.Bin047]